MTARVLLLVTSPERQYLLNMNEIFRYYLQRGSLSGECVYDGISQSLLGVNAKKFLLHLTSSCIWPRETLEIVVLWTAQLRCMVLSQSGGAQFNIL